MEKNIPNNKTGKPLELYSAQFAALEPKTMEQRSGFAYDEADSSFKMRFFGREVRLHYPDMTLRRVSGEPIEDHYTRILLARAVMEGIYKKSAGAYLAYSEVPWGNVYLRQFNGRCILRLAFSFGSCLDKFEAACLELGGVPCGGADKGFVLEFLDELKLKLLIWAPDDEFPPSAQILFSDNFPAMFSAEDLAVAGDILIGALKGIK